MKKVFARTVTFLSLLVLGTLAPATYLLAAGTSAPKSKNRVFGKTLTEEIKRKVRANRPKISELDETLKDEAGMTLTKEGMTKLQEMLRKNHENAVIEVLRSVVKESRVENEIEVVAGLLRFSNVESATVILKDNEGKFDGLKGSMVKYWAEVGREFPLVSKADFKSNVESALKGVEASRAYEIGLLKKDPELDSDLSQVVVDVHNAIDVTVGRVVSEQWDAAKINNFQKMVSELTTSKGANIFEKIVDRLIDVQSREFYKKFIKDCEK